MAEKLTPEQEEIMAKTWRGRMLKLEAEVHALNEAIWAAIREDWRKLWRRR